MIDAFIGARVPASLLAAGTLIDAARVAPLTLINVVDDRAGAPRRARPRRRRPGRLPKVWTIGNKRGNTIVAGCTNARRPGLAHLAARVAADRSPARLIERHG